MPSLSADARRVSANSMNNWKTDGPSVDVVTRLSQPAADQESRRGTARDDYHWSGRVESHCETTKFGFCPTGGQVVAGSNPVSPTQLRSHFRTKLWSLIGPRTPTRTPTEFCTSRAFSRTC